MTPDEIAALKEILQLHHDDNQRQHDQIYRLLYLILAALFGVGGMATYGVVG